MSGALTFLPLPPTLRLTTRSHCSLSGVGCAGHRHYVVWVDLPLFHPLLCTDPSRSTFLPSHLARAASAPSSGTATPSGPSHRNPLASPAHSGELDAALVAPTKGSWDHVSAKGLGGLTGAAERRWRARRGAQVESEGSGTEGGREEGPEREIRAFVERRWPEKDGWETAWCVALSGLRCYSRLMSPLGQHSVAQSAALTLCLAPGSSTPQVRQPTLVAERPRARALSRARAAGYARDVGPRTRWYAVRGEAWGGRMSARRCARRGGRYRRP